MAARPCRASILRDGRPSKSVVADFDTLRLPKSGEPDFGGRPPQDEVRIISHAHSTLRGGGASSRAISARKCSRLVQPNRWLISLSLQTGREGQRYRRFRATK